jgi:hypothetical protein
VAGVLLTTGLLLVCLLELAWLQPCFNNKAVTMLQWGWHLGTLLSERHM